MPSGGNSSRKRFAQVTPRSDSFKQPQIAFDTGNLGSLLGGGRPKTLKATPPYYLEAISGVSLPAVQQPSTGIPEEWPHQRHYGRGVGAGGVRPSSLCIPRCFLSENTRPLPLPHTRPSRSQNLTIMVQREKPMGDPRETWAGDLSESTPRLDCGCFA